MPKAAKKLFASTCVIPRISSPEFLGKTIVVVSNKLGCFLGLSSFFGGKTFLGKQNKFRLVFGPSPQVVEQHPAGAFGLAFCWVNLLQGFLFQAFSGALSVLPSSSLQCWLFIPLG